MPDGADTRSGCLAVRRPQELLGGTSAVHGLRAAQARFAGQQLLLDVWLYANPPAQLATPAAWHLEPSPGGRRVTVDTVTTATGVPVGHLTLALKGQPDTARYRLEVTKPTPVPFDPLRTWLPVRLRPDCPDVGSCFELEPGPAASASPVHDYTARDWRSLRGALVEFLGREDQGADLSPADPAVTLLELFAHIGDLLHYRLDRVATEAYLETARLRTSVRRHARIVDYRFADGTAARTFVHVSVPPGQQDVDVFVGDVAANQAGSPLAFTIERPPRAKASTGPVLVARPALGELPIYDWGEPGCRLTVGATECVLVRPKPADGLGDQWLEPGDFLTFEIVRAHVSATDPQWHEKWARRKKDWPTPDQTFRDPLPGRPAQVVELATVEPFHDPLAAAVVGPGMRLTRVTWRDADALVHAFPVGVDDSTGFPQVAVARGNVAPAHHGRLADGPGTLAPVLPEAADVQASAPSQFALVACGSPARTGGPGGGLALNAHGRPYRLDVDVALPSGQDVHPPVLPTLLEAEPGELAAVVEIEEDSPPVLRFATGAAGIIPPLGSTVRAAYEVGGGEAGNVPANVLTVLEHNEAAVRGVPKWKVIGKGVRARNPVAAAGGAPPTPLDDVRRDAPEAFAAEPRRAVLAADHATIVGASPLVQRASAAKSWTGAWPLITTLVDLAGSDAAEALPPLAAAAQAARLLGTEAYVVEGRAIGLFVSLEICGTPGAYPAILRDAALRVLRPGSDEHPGVFHRSRLELGRAVYVSAVVAAVAALPQVDAVKVVEARRLDDPAGMTRAVITFAPDEVAVLDDDPARPERGRLDVQVRSGR